MIWSCTANGFITYLSPELEILTGRPADQALGNAWRGYIHSDDLDVILKDFCRARAASVPFTFHFRVRNSQAEFVNLVCSATPLFLPRQRVLAGYVGAIMRHERQSCVRNANVVGRAMAIDLSGREIPMHSVAEYLRVARAKVMAAFKHHKEIVH